MTSVYSQFSIKGNRTTSSDIVVILLCINDVRLAPNGRWNRFMSAAKIRKRQTSTSINTLTERCRRLASYKNAEERKRTSDIRSTCETTAVSFKRDRFRKIL